ncbi:uncharacterized protein K452DRAFT_319061 [Aplosporella prunicola CBS 121167]|uniref:Uncharacterized protein n=1 Tax=Aplosporella prunicola CBS 121167 TaxID=1176127 RepID=A0A6A6BB60_9PEZI|nr:uncharacterized protein K452DRAFT_319061 [Aplosporella prunicola CBS 121167]KAF2141449.1 hypothetical protein K452DRAFT_319061 [Aplosporella prunicola CBS 121167]
MPGPLLPTYLATEPLLKRPEPEPPVPKATTAPPSPTPPSPYTRPVELVMVLAQLGSSLCLGAAFLDLDAGVPLARPSPAIRPLYHLFDRAPNNPLTPTVAVCFALFIASAYAYCLVSALGALASRPRKLLTLAGSAVVGLVGGLAVGLTLLEAAFLVVPVCVSAGLGVVWCFADVGRGDESEDEGVGMVEMSWVEEKV